MVPVEDEPEINDPVDDFSLDIDSYNLSVLPGETASVKISISNQGSAENRLNFEVSGIPHTWIVDPLKHIHLQPGSGQTVSLAIKPPRSFESQAGRYRVKIEVSDDNDPGKTNNVFLTLTVQSFDEFQSEVQPQQITSNQDFKIIVKNLSNTREGFDIYLEDQVENFSFNPPSAKVLVSPGETGSARIKATLRMPNWFGGEHRYFVTARVSSQRQTSQDHSLEIISKPILSGWILLVPLVLCIIAGCFIAQSLTASSLANVYNEIAQGLSLGLNLEEPESEIILKSPSPTIIPSNTPTTTPTITPTPTTSPTPLPDGYVLFDEIPVWAGPGEEFSQDHELLKGETLDVIGQFDNCNWLKITAGEGVEGWVSGAASDVQLNLVCSDIPRGTYRPKNGTLVFADMDLDGFGELTVENGTSRDGLIVLVDSSAQPLLAFYVRSDKEYNLEGIPDGNYEIFFSQGEEWDGEVKQFTSRTRYLRFEDPFDFTTTPSLYPGWRITLQPVPEGTAETSSVDPEEFPDLIDVP